MRSLQTNPRTVIDLAAARRQRRPHHARWTYAFAAAADVNDDAAVLVQFGRHLEQQGLSSAERLAAVVALPDELWDEAWAQLRQHIERERELTS